MSATTIPYLRRLDADLEGAARRAASKGGRGQDPRRRRPDRGSWLRWSGAAAAILVVAWGIGTGLGGTVRTQGSASRFSQVGSAVGGAGGGVADDLGGGEDGPAATPAPADPTTGQPNEPGSGSVDLAKIDRDGTLALKIDEGSFRDAFAEVIRIAEANGGMLLASETVGGGSGRLTLRVPADRFDRAFVEIGRLGEVRASTVTGKDVTAEYIDLRARLRILEGRREVIFDLYDRATTLEQALRLEGELNDVQLEIDRIRGQLRYLDAQTSISTLKVTLSESEADVEALAQEDERADLGEAFSSAADGFLAVFAAIIVGLGYLIPVAVVAGAIYGVVTLVRRRGRAAS